MKNVWKIIWKTLVTYMLASNSNLTHVPVLIVFVNHSNKLSIFLLLILIVAANTGVTCPYKHV